MGYQTTGLLLGSFFVISLFSLAWQGRGEGGKHLLVGGRDHIPDVEGDTGVPWLILQWIPAPTDDAEKA